MSAPPSGSGAPIETHDQLVDWIASGCKPRAAWRIGTEHEKFAFRLADLKPLPYAGPDGIGAILEGLTRFGWEPIEEAGATIALKGTGSCAGCTITLEPGGQFELSGAPVASIHATCAEVSLHLQQVKEVGRELGIAMLGLGFNPKWKRDDIPWMPKGRYAIMRRYMPLRGGLGLDMMLRTCTVQTNLDYASEADMVAKFRVSLALQPIATALFANSPFKDGRPNGFLSYRAHVWTDTDPDRCGILPFVFEPGFGFARYVDYLLDVPMYFVYRDGRYIDAAGQSFRDFLAGRLPALPGEIPTISDFVDHTTTVFPEVRLKRFLEMRGADGGPWGRICALPAFWVGLLYDETALDEAQALIDGWTVPEMEAMRLDVTRLGLAARFRDVTVQELAIRALEIARGGLERRRHLDGIGHSEAGFLRPLQRIAETGRSPAQALLERFHMVWNGEIDPIFQEEAY